MRQLSHPPASPLNRLPTCVEYRALRLCLPTNVRLFIGYRVSDLASDRPLTCASDQPFVSAVRFTTGLRRRFDLRASPSTLAFDLRRQLRSPVLSAINFRVPSEFEFLRRAVDSHPTCVVYSSLGGASEPTFRSPSNIASPGLAFQLSSDLRRPSIFQPFR